MGPISAALCMRHGRGVVVGYTPTPTFHTQQQPAWSEITLKAIFALAWMYSPLVLASWWGVGRMRA
jgi:hypothetical protein